MEKYFQQVKAWNVLWNNTCRALPDLTASCIKHSGTLGGAPDDGIVEEETCPWWLPERPCGSEDWKTLSQPYNSPESQKQPEEFVVKLQAAPRGTQNATRRRKRDGLI